MQRKSDRFKGPEWDEARRKAKAYADSLTPEEDARITAAAKDDPDAQPLDEKRKALTYAEHVELGRWRSRRGPQKAPTKTLVPLRLDGDVIAHFRASGAGWQARINEALRKAAGLSPR
jgi:uncharacterized protein (DUF4415 family)